MGPESQVRARCVFRGRVQGVFFRANCEADADRRGLRGWVRNLEDGTVEAVLEGPRGAVEAAIRWNRESQPHARVAGVEVEWGEATGEFDGFRIR
jgi:acylphosphatase